MISNAAYPPPNAAELQKIMAQQQQQQAVAGTATPIILPSSNGPYHTASSVNTIGRTQFQGDPGNRHNAYGPPDLIVMIRMRMRWPEYLNVPLGALMVAQNGSQVVTVVVNPGQEPVTIVEDFGLFPSDALVTQLRLLEAK